MEEGYITIGDIYKSKTYFDFYLVKQIFTISNSEIYFRLANISSNKETIITQEQLMLQYIEVKELSKIGKD